TRDVETPGGVQTRAVILWDFAGQPGYRVFQQQRLDRVAAALVVFDPISSRDPFDGIRSWVRALAQQRGMEGPAALPLKIYLVAARMDRGRLAVSPQRIRQVVVELHLDSFFETSALTGERIAEVAQAIQAGIDWDNLPTVSSSDLFRSVWR